MRTSNCPSPPRSFGMTKTIAVVKATTSTMKGSLPGFGMASVERDHSEEYCSAEERGIKVIVFATDLEKIGSWFEVPKRYYQRNKELVEACDLLHAFISKEDGFTGGTRFEVEYAASIGIPVLLHWGNGFSEWLFQYSLPFWQGKQGFLLSWEGFFHRIRPELGAST